MAISFVRPLHSLSYLKVSHQDLFGLFLLLLLQTSSILSTHFTSESISLLKITNVTVKTNTSRTANEPSFARLKLVYEEFCQARAHLKLEFEAKAWLVKNFAKFRLNSGLAHLYKTSFKMSLFLSFKFKASLN